MCDFTPVRNWLIAVGVLIGGAVSSAMFGWAWSYAKVPWGAIVSSIGFWAALTWGTAAMAALGFGFKGALDTFCACTASKPICAAACADANAAYGGLMLALFGFNALSFGCAAYGAPTPLLILLAVSIAAVLAGSIALTLAAAKLSSCQSGASPTPPPPPTGGGPLTSPSDDRFT
jgi:hypothetical protein